MDSSSEFHQKVSQAIGSDVELRTLSDATLVDCINLDIATTKEEVLDAIKKQIEGAENLSLASIKDQKETRGGT